MHDQSTFNPPALPILLVNDHRPLPSDPDENFMFQILFRLVLRHGPGRLDCPAPGGGWLLSCPLSGAWVLSLQRPDQSGALALLAWDRRPSTAAWAEFIEAHQVLHKGDRACPPPRPEQSPFLAISFSPRLLARGSTVELQSVQAELMGAASALAEYHSERPRWN